MFQHMPSETCAATIFIKLVMGWNIGHEERCPFDTQGHMLISHTFIESKTSKHFMLLSVLCTHTPHPSVSLWTQYSNVKFPNIAWTQFKLCASNNLNHVTQQGGKRGILILVMLCDWKDVIYFLLVNIFQVILMVQCHLMEVSTPTAYLKYRDWQTHGFTKNSSCI